MTQLRVIVMNEVSIWISINGGTPKWLVYKGNIPLKLIWGYPYFRKRPCGFPMISIRPWVFTAFQMSPPWVLNRVPFRKGANWEVQLVFVHGYIYGITLWDSNSCKCFVWALIGLGCTSSPLIKLDLQPQVEQALSDKISLFGFPPKKQPLKKRETLMFQSIEIVLELLVFHYGDLAGV